MRIFKEKAAIIEDEYEYVEHGMGNFRIFLVNLLYRTPHTHKDFEISIILDGEVRIQFPNQNERILKKDDIFVLNSFISHEITAESPAMIMSLQVPTSFFSNFYPQLDSIAFDENIFHKETSPKLCSEVRKYLFFVARQHYQADSLSALRCASQINALFVTLLESIPTHTVSAQEYLANKAKGMRLRRIISYIEEHYTEKLLLSDIAANEDLDLYYLSHLFSDSLGVSFQTFLTRLRCEKARALLLLTDRSLLDISMSLGFSDPKYFNKGFYEQYGCTPKEYRKQFATLELQEQQNSMLSTQEFLSPNSSLVVLDRIEA